MKQMETREIMEGRLKQENIKKLYGNLQFCNPNETLLKEIEYSCHDRTGRNILEALATKEQKIGMV